MKVSQFLAVMALTASFGFQIQAAPDAKEKSDGFHLTIELRDGSRILGKSLEDNLRFRSDVLGEIRLPLKKIRSVEYQGEGKLPRLVTSASDTLSGELAMKEIKVETVFGDVRLPVSQIKMLRVSAIVKAGRTKDGLLGLWSGDGTANDSVNGNNGLLQNVGFTQGVSGQAFSFASDSYAPGTYVGVQIPDKPAYELTNSLTIEGWIHPRGNGYVIFFRGDHRSGLDPYALSMDGALNLNFGICGQDGTSANAQTPVTRYAWIYVAAVLDGDAGTMSLYTNGVMAAQVTTTVRPFGPLLPNESPGIGIGNVNDGGNNFPFIGEIDEIGLYNRALSEEEINAIYAEHAANAGDLPRVAPIKGGPYGRVFPRSRGGDSN